MALLYINTIPAIEQAAFTAKVQSVAKFLGVQPNWLMQVMKSESGINPAIENKAYPFSNGYATGLIQFTPDTAIGLGTTVAQLKQMNRVQQMDWVAKYFSPYRGKLKSYFDVYLTTFFPVAISHSGDDNWVFETSKISRSSVARSNPAIDINKDGKITMGEFKQYVKNTVPKANWPAVFTSAAGIGSLFFLVAVGVVVWQWDNIKKLI
jgi:hypothetical protein